MAKLGSKLLLTIAVLWSIIFTGGIVPVRASDLFIPNIQTKSPRIGSTTLTLRDGNGTPWTNSNVKYIQTSHDFLFGVGMTSPRGKIPQRIYENLRAIGINYALPFTTWAGVESPEGTFRWSYIDTMYSPVEMKRLGYTLNGHCMISFNDKPYTLPAYMRDWDYEKLKQATAAHVFTLVDHYKGNITYWTINEPTYPYTNFFKLSKSQWLELANIVAQSVRKADPKAKIMVNVVPIDEPRQSYSAQSVLDAFVDAGIPFDVIGIELYAIPGYKSTFDHNGYPSIAWSSAMLDSFARFNKPIILSEVGVPDKPSPQTQAKWLREFYAMSFDKPSVLGITWYFLDDGAFLPGGGLFPDFNSPPRLAYQELANVIQERTTQGSAKVDSQGVVRIEGFAGDYRLEVSDGTRNASFTIHITEQKDSLVTLSLPTPTPMATSTPLPTETRAATTSPTSSSTIAQVQESPIPKPTPQLATTTTLQQDMTWVAVIVVAAAGSATLIFIIRRRMIKDANGQTK